MVNDKKKIEGVTRGNDYTLKLNVFVPASITTARLIVKKDINDPDSSAIISKLATTSTGTDGQIVDQGGGDNVAVVLFFLTKTETNLFIADEIYDWDMEVFDSAGNAAIPRGASGTIQFDERTRTAIG